MQQQSIKRIEIKRSQIRPENSVQPVEHTATLKIVILQRGWVYVGRSGTHRQ